MFVQQFSIDDISESEQPVWRRWKPDSMLHDRVRREVFYCVIV